MLTDAVPMKPIHQGFALATALIMLVIVTLLALAGARMALDSRKVANNQRDRDIAFQAAEAALRDAEFDIEGGTRMTAFDAGAQSGFVKGSCGISGNARGLCETADGSNVPIWQTVNFDDVSGDAPSVAYGTFTNNRFSAGAGLLPARLPRYIIEPMQLTMEGTSAGVREKVPFYRITAVGFGPNPTVRVMLQTFYYKVTP
jgi:type IV pilus assembly protein PilX